MECGNCAKLRKALVKVTAQMAEGAATMCDAEALIKQQNSLFGRGEEALTGQRAILKLLAAQLSELYAFVEKVTARVSDDTPATALEGREFGKVMARSKFLLKAHYDADREAYGDGET